MHLVLNGHEAKLVGRRALARHARQDVRSWRGVRGEWIDCRKSHYSLSKEYSPTRHAFHVGGSRLSPRR